MSAFGNGESLSIRIGPLLNLRLVLCLRSLKLSVICQFYIEEQFDLQVLRVWAWPKYAPRAV